MPTPILICDDSSLARKQMARSLPDDWDVSISFATNGLEGIEAIQQGLAEIMFLDLNMPEMDGYEVLETIRKLDLPTMVIVISGDVQPEAYQRVINLGALDFIKKPVDNNEIINILKKYGIYTGSTPTKPTRADSSDIKVDIFEAYQEVANIAMGQAADLLARLLDAFIVLPVPKVSMLDASDLRMALHQIDENEELSAICQGFIGSGIAGEALIIFNDTSFQDIAELMKYEGDIDETMQVELLTDISSILAGAFLKGFTHQLDITFSQSHPMILGQHIKIPDILNQQATHWDKTLAIEISYSIEKRNIQCELLLLFTEDSIEPMNDRVSYILEEQ